MKQRLNKNWMYPLLVAVSFCLALPVSAETEKVEKKFEVKAGGTLIVESDQGSIEVETWNKNEVVIIVDKHARTKERLDEFKVKTELRGNDVYVLGKGEWNSRVDVEFKLKVPKEYNVDLSTGGGSIQVDDIKGNVKVDTSGGSIKIGNVEAGNVDADTSGGSIKVGDVDGKLKVSTSGGSIKLGKVSGKSDIDTSGGSISLEAGGDDVKADTSGGSIKIGPVKGKVKVETSGGSINIDEAEGDVDADTSGGSVKVAGSKGSVTVESSGGSLFVGYSGGPVKADTAGGSIKILQAKGSIDAETSGGSIMAEMILDDEKADTHVTLDSAGGDLTLFLPKNVKASVSAKLKLTRNARRDYRIYSDFPLTIKGEDSNLVTADGNINGGGDPIKLETTNGDIYIKMLDQYIPIQPSIR